MDKRRREEVEEEEDIEMVTAMATQEEEYEIAGNVQIWQEKIKEATEECKNISEIHKKTAKSFGKEESYGESKESVHNVALLFNRLVVKDPGSKEIATVE